MECIISVNKAVVFFLLTLMSFRFQAFGQNVLTKYRRDIENFIMKGYGDGWKHCDVIDDISKRKQPIPSDGAARFVMTPEKLHTLDIKTTFSSSYCILISAQIKDNETLFNLIRFGWSAVQRKRIALVLELGQGMSLQMATNTTRLPFVVVARLEGGRDQFLCPIIGYKNPRLQESKCEASYTSYSGKSLRVGAFGLPPYFYGKFSI